MKNQHRENLQRSSDHLGNFDSAYLFHGILLLAGSVSSGFEALREDAIEWNTRSNPKSRNIKQENTFQPHTIQQEDEKDGDQTYLTCMSVKLFQVSRAQVDSRPSYADLLDPEDHTHVPSTWTTRLLVRQRSNGFSTSKEATRFILLRCLRNETKQLRALEGHPVQCVNNKQQKTMHLYTN
eukprot:6489412-Amphidinium_carterae.1